MEEPSTPPPAVPAVKTTEGEHRGPHDLPSPPVSLTKAPSQHSNDDAEFQSHCITSLDNSVNDTSMDESQFSSTSRYEQSLAVPPSPPQSTHSSEDLHSSLRPSYFYPQPLDLKVTSNDVHISPDDAPGIPVFEPTWEEFKDFYTYCQRIDEWGMKTGIVKIIPPKEWTHSLPRLDGKQGNTSIASKQLLAGLRYTADNPLSQIRIKNSIEQIFTPTGSGSWRQSNVVHPGRVLNAKQWADLCIAPSQKGPEMSRMKENAKREGDDGAEKDGIRTRSGRGNRAGSGQASTFISRTTTKRKRSNEGRKQAMEEQGKKQAEQEDALLMIDLPALEEVDSSNKTKLKIADRTSQDEWNAFDYVEGWCREAGQDSCPQDWNPSVCKEIESEYWRGLNFGKAPMYGADLKGTLFTSATQHWNVGVLDNILTRLRLRRKLPGVTTPYLYFGMWRATFAWHVEDMDLYSINYIHFGAPKQWYAIRQSDRQRFELAMAGAFPSDSARCKHFMRHKSYLASPAFLAANAGIKPLRLVQKAQEFVITYPYGYHSGFNLGYNCAESVNFALESWLDIGRKAGYCDCANDSVKMDVDAMLEESKEMMELDRKREEKERRKEAEEQMMQSELEKLESKRAKERERRKAKKEEQARLQSLGLFPIKTREDKVDEEEDSIQPAKKAKKEALPCILCPSMSEEDLVVIPPCLQDEAELNKKPIRRAHRLCACFLPETWVAPNPRYQKGSKEPHEIVMGFAGIEKARWSLKCQNCFDSQSAKKGAKVQCTFGKCSRTTHVSCALYESSGWMLDMLEDEEADALEGKAKKVSKGEDGVAQGESAVQKTVQEGSAPRTVILCRSHNPREREREAQRRAEILLRCVKTLTVGQLIKIRANSGGVYETLLADIKYPQCPANEGEVVVDDQVVKWSKILFDPDIVKKVDLELKRSEEESLLTQTVEAIAQPVETKVVEDEATIQARLEKEELKAKAKAAKEVAKQAKEEQKRIKEAVKLQKKAEKDAKAMEREAKAKIKEQKKAEREAKAAQKLARAAEFGSQKQSNHNQQPSDSASGPFAIAKSSPYGYITQWIPKKDYQHNAPRPVLPMGSAPNMDRILAPIYPHSMSSTQTSYNTYPPHLATFQDRHLAHPMYQTHYPNPHQHSQVANRSIATLSHLQNTSLHASRPTPPTFANHQQGYLGSQNPPQQPQSHHQHGPPPSQRLLYPMNGAAPSKHEAVRPNPSTYSSHKYTTYTS